MKKKKGIRLLDSKIVINEEDVIYSDHFGLCSTFEVVEESSQSKASKNKNKMSIESSLEMKDETEDETEELTLDDSKSKNQLLNDCSDIIKLGTKVAQKRKTSHLIRCVISIMLLWLFISLEAPSPWIGALSIYMAVEFFIAMFVVENDLAALRETHKEIKFFTK